ncbi:TIGR02391 family protein [Streptomyces sp. NPDC057582]|uniref:TIGR02391 family protein n=1 Tax=Streptomyces sp. NPDC057582 TaxID=3346174 RepID=UPI003678A98B
MRKLNAESRNKVGNRNVSETDLFKQASLPDDPKPGGTRLRRMKDEGSGTYKSVQRGAMVLAEGLFAGICNPLSRDRQEALEYLASLSVLVRWVDGSSVEAVS